MKTVEFEATPSIITEEEVPEPDLKYYRPTCEFKWGINYKNNIVLLQKYEGRFPEKSLKSIWNPVRFTK